MKRGWIIILLIFLFLLLGVMVKWGAILIGSGSYKLMESRVRQLQAEEIETAKEEFLGDGKDNNIYTGTVAKIFKSGIVGVSIWSSDGLKYFPADKYTTYSYYDVCV